MRAVTSRLAAALFLALSSPALAQVSDVEVPNIVLDTGPDAEGKVGDDEAIDLANIVQSAAKGVTTVQEAPAIVSRVCEIQRSGLVGLSQWG